MSKTKGIILAAVVAIGLIYVAKTTLTPNEQLTPDEPDKTTQPSPSDVTSTPPTQEEISAALDRLTSLNEP